MAPASSPLRPTAPTSSMPHPSNSTGPPTLNVRGTLLSVSTIRGLSLKQPRKGCSITRMAPGWTSFAIFEFVEQSPLSRDGLLPFRGTRLPATATEQAARCHRTEHQRQQKREQKEPELQQRRVDERDLVVSRRDPDGAADQIRPLDGGGRAVERSRPVGVQRRGQDPVAWLSSLLRAPARACSLTCMKLLDMARSAIALGIQRRLFDDNAGEPSRPVRDPRHDNR